MTPICCSFTRSAPSRSLLMGTRTQISGCEGLKRILCQKILTVSYSCNLSVLWSLITSSGTQACSLCAQCNICNADLIRIPFQELCSIITWDYIFYMHVDRGNDNWLLKYDCPMDPVGNRVRNLHNSCTNTLRPPLNMLIPTSISFPYLHL